MADITVPFAANCTPATAPTTNAPDPTCAAADVVSIYGDTYTSIATNYDPNWGQSGHGMVNAAYDPGTGNSVLAYPNFNYQGTEMPTTDLSGMTYLHFDIWTAADPANTTIQVSPVNHSSGTGTAEVLVDVPFVSGEWTSIDLPITDFAGMTWDAVFQMKFAANGAGSTNPVDMYLDNIYFSTCSNAVLTAPTTNAPDPTCAAADVVSIYGDTYTSIATNYDPNWGQSGHGMVNAAYDPGTGNSVLAYPNFNYQGTEMPTTDLSGMTYLHFDIWTAADPANTTIQVSPVNHSSGTGTAEVLVDVPFVSGEWTSIDLPITDFAGMTWDAVFQMKFAANGAGSTNPVDMYLDNIYFSTCSNSTLTAPITNAPDPTCAAADVVSIYGDTYTSIATNYDPNWGQSGHGMVNAAYDPGTGNSVLAYPNFNYQGTEMPTTDLSGMTYLHFDIWTAADPANTTIQVSPVNHSSGTGTAEVLVDVPFVSGEWTSIDLPITDFAGMTWDAVFQMKFAANGAGSTNPVDMYLDNIYFSTCSNSTLTAPITNAPDPTCAAADVVSIYGDTYTSIATNYDPNWGQSGHGMVNAAYDPGTGNSVLAYPNFNYQGTEMPTTDLSGMTYLHFDIWTAADPANTTIQVSPVNHSSGTGTAEVLVDVPFVSGEWTSIDLPITDFAGMTWDAVFQMKFAANGAGSTNPVDMYLDNIYLSTCSNLPESPYCATSVTHFAGDADSEISLTIANSGANTMTVTAESANADPLDALIVQGGSGAMIGAATNPSTGVYEIVLTWTGTPPDDVMLNLLWSKESAPGGGAGNWLLSQSDITIPFLAECPYSIEITDPCNCDDQVIVGGTTYAQETVTINGGTAPFNVTAIAGLYDATGTLYTTATATAAISGSTLIGYVPADNAATYTITIEDSDGASDDLMGGPCDVCPICTISASECTACTGCDDSYEIELQNINNFANTAAPNFTSTGTAMAGTITLPVGSNNVFAGASAERLLIPHTQSITDICATADVEVISGDYPFLLELRIENPAGGSRLSFNQMVDGPGMCSIGGSLSDALDEGGFSWDNSCLSFVVATAFFPGDASTLAKDRIINISNMTLNVCSAESEQPEITCPNTGPNLYANAGFDSGDLTGWSQFGNGGIEQNIGDPLPSAFLFDFSGNFGASGIFQSFTVAEGDFYCIGADFMALACDGGNSQIFGTDDFFELNIRYLDANGIALNGPGFCNGAPFGPLCGTPFQTPMSSLTADDLNKWLKAYGCFQAPVGAVSVEAIIAINDGSTSDGGAVLVDNATFNNIIPQTFVANAASCMADVTLTDPVPTDNCGVVSFTDSFNGTGMASGTYPMGQTLVTYTATDDAGNEACCSIVVQVTEDAPEITCPADIVMQLGPGECEALVEFEFSANSNCDADILNSLAKVDDTGLDSGDMFPYGVYELEYSVTDASGVADTCTFMVEILEFVPTNTSLSCNDHINLSVDNNCEITLLADFFLEGNIYGCYDDYEIYISPLGDDNNRLGPFTGSPSVTLPRGNHTYMVLDPDTGNSCWGTVLIEDSSAPTQDDIDAACGAGGGDIPCDQVGRYLDAANTTLGRPSGFTVGCVSYEWQLHDIDFTSTNSGCEYEITRTFRIYWTDKNGVEGFGECSRVFNSVPFNGTVTQPQAVVTLPCGSDLSPQAVADLGLANGGGDARAYPKIGSTVLNLEGEVCGVRATYTDQHLDACAPGCAGTMKIVRTWRIIDWCEAIDGDADNGVDEFIQVLKAVDEEAPTFSVVDITVGTNPWDCTGNFELPEVEVHDNCDANPTYVGTTGPVQEIVQGGVPTRRFVGAPIGVHEFDVSYTDCCGNIGTRTVTVTVVDNVGPVVSTVQDIVVSLTPGGPNPEDASAKIYWYHVDNQSYDACTDVTVEIRRPAGDPACNNVGSGGHNNNVTFNNDGHSDDNNRDTDGGQFVKFCCADLEAATVDVNGDGTNDEGYVEVIVRAYDALGNYNEAWSFVKVEDNSAPIISGPAAATIYCDWPIEDNFDSRTYTSRGAAAGSNKYVSADGVDFDKTGVATAYSTCGATSIEYVDVIITTEGDGIDQCGAGQFTRIFRAVKTDKNGNAQVRHHFQKITILGRDGDADVTQDINNPAGVGPEDIGPFMVGCDGPSQADIDMYSPVVVGSDPCDVIGRAIEIDTFFFEQGACKKWTVEYKFVNWCDDEEWNDFELVTFMYIDTEKPVMTGCQDTMYAQSDVANCQHALELENSATDNGGCAGPENAWLKWQVYVDLWGDGTIDAYGSSYAFTGSWRKTNSANPFLPSNPNWSSDVWVVNVEATGSGEATDIPALPAELIQGNMSNHKVTWKVTDGCHNFASCSEEFMVVDKKAPTPYCRNLSTAVMNGSDMVELWAIDFNVDSEDNCTDKENLRYTFTDVKPQDDPLYDPTTRSSSRVFNCEDVPGGVYRMYVWDEKDNFDYCEVDLTVVDNDDSCDPIVEECQITEYTGWAVATCNAEAGTGGAVAVLHDIRNTGNAPSGEDWGPSITQVHPSNWTIDAIGQVFGIAIGEDENIYLAASDIYDTQQNSDPYGPGQIFIANANNGFEAEPFVELPNTGGALNGIGNIAYCTNNSMLYASNLEDGKIYRINSTGAIMESYDPWSSDDGSAGIVSQSEQVWGIGLNEESGSKKLYFARIGNGERSMYSIVLNSNGSFPSTGSETVAFGDIMGVGERISDIDFNTAGNKMIFTERGTFFTTGAHNSKMLGYELNNGTWSMELKYHIGALVSDVFPEFDVATGENAAGGVTFGATNVSSTGIEGEDEVVWSTANWFRKADGRLFYGMQGMSASGNNPHNATVDPNISTDMFVDFDGEYDNYNQKGDLGDLEIIGCSVGSTSNRGTISGTIATAGGQVVANITTTIAAVLPEYPRTDATNALGVYMFENNPMNVEYTLTAEKNTGLLEGVNTLDLVKIQRHLLGLELLNDPYKVIAADIDNDESIRPGDLLTLRKAILGLSSEFTNNTSWRFVDGSQSNDDLSLVNDYINTGESLTTDMMNEDFVAVKVGDVDGTVNGLLANGNIQSRSGNAITLVTDNKTVVAGELVEVTFTSEELNDVYGYQFTMDLQGLEFAGVTAGLLNMTESNVGVLNSAVTVSYNDVKAMNAGTAEGLFTMSFVATEAGDLSEMISSTSSVTRAEAYVGENLETVGVEIAMRGANTAVAQYELLQNEPNPFKTTTTIGYTRPTAGSADFTVLDVTGKVLMSRKVTGVAGYNEVTINKGDINVSGVLYYTLSTGDFTDTKKMIIIE